MNTGNLAVSWIDSLAAFFPGLQVLLGDVDLAIRPHLLYFTIWQKYRALPERFNIHTIDTVINSYPLRPEIIESTYMLFQATKNHYYLRVGEEILRDIEELTKVECGYVGLEDVKRRIAGDRMESFFLSETLKYLYLLFDTEHIINTHDGNFIFTTEGHLMILPRGLTDLEGSSAPNQICPKSAFEGLVQDGPALSQDWVRNLKKFIEGKPDTSIVSPSLISVMYDTFSFVRSIITLIVIYQVSFYIYSR